MSHDISLRYLTGFITLTRVDPVYTAGNSERKMHNVKSAQHHHDSDLLIISSLS